MKHLCLILIFVSHLQLLFGWGVEGHRIVAKIAYDNLNKKAQRRIDDLLGKQGIVYYSTWADDIKSDSSLYPHSDYWHYQDLPEEMTQTDLVATLTDYPADGGNLWRKTDSLLAVLKNYPNDTDALKFIIHLVGDRFCPMHTGHLDDKGGNTLMTTWFGTKTNLHAIWDTKLIDYYRYSYSEYATYLENIYGKEKKSILNTTRQEELIQNYNITNDIYRHYEKWNGNAYHYAYKWKDILNLQLYRSGITLAKILNEIYNL